MILPFRFPISAFPQGHKPSPHLETPTAHLVLHNLCMTRHCTNACQQGFTKEWAPKALNSRLGKRTPFTMRLITTIAALALFASTSDAFLSGHLPILRSHAVKNSRDFPVSKNSKQGRVSLPSIRMEGNAGTEIRPVITNEGKKSHTTDVVVIGAGLGGLCAGALLVSTHFVSTYMCVLASRKSVSTCHVHVSWDMQGDNMSIFCMHLLDILPEDAKDTGSLYHNVGDSPHNWINPCTHMNPYKLRRQHTHTHTHTHTHKPSHRYAHMHAPKHASHI